MSNGNKYMVYERDDGGRLTRTHRTIILTAEQARGDYAHPEALAGWPESRVYWSAALGRSIGIAPMSAAARAALCV